MKQVYPYPDAKRFPMKDFDMVKEGILSLIVITVLVLIVAAIAGAPYRPAVTNQQVAMQSPLVIEQTALGDLDGSGSIASYGPPYNNGTGSVQSIAGFSPQTWWGVSYPVNTATDDVITPLSMLASASGNSQLAKALATYQAAPAATQAKWNQNLSNALNKATVVGATVKLPAGNYGPVAYMMNSELQLARSGLLSGALSRETNQGVYRWNVQNNLLFLQGDALHDLAGKADLSGEQWGINHDEQAYPGPWWLTPYTFFYQVPPWNTSAAGDEMTAYSVGILFLLLLVVPWVPGLNRLPRLLPLYKLIWRDWYRNEKDRKKDNKAGTEFGAQLGRSH